MEDPKTWSEWGHDVFRVLKVKGILVIYNIFVDSLSVMDLGKGPAPLSPSYFGFKKSQKENSRQDKPSPEGLVLPVTID